MDEMKRAKIPSLPLSGGLAEAQKEALAQLKEDPRVYALIHDEFKLTTAETKLALSPLLDYLDDLHYCDHCPGLEHCDKPAPHYQMELFREDGLMDHRLRLCEKARKDEAYNRQFLDREFPDEWKEKTLKGDVERTANKKVVLKTLVDTLNHQSDAWVYLRGNRRSGRTFVLACFASDYARKQLGSIAFVDAAAFLERLKNLYFTNKDAFEKQLNVYSTCSLLILDDFGNEVKDKTGNAFSSILFPLLNARAKKDLLTCFSSDFTIDEIAAMYQPSLGLPRAKQYKNLLRDMCRKTYDITSTLDVH